MWQWKSCLHTPSHGGPSLITMRVRELIQHMGEQALNHSWTAHKSWPCWQKVKVIQAYGCGPWRVAPAPSLVCKGKRNIPLLTPCHFCQAAGPTWGTWEWYSWSCPSSSAAICRAGPASPLGKTEERLRWGKCGETGPEKMKAGELALLLSVCYIGRASQGCYGNFIYIVAHSPMKSGVASRVGFPFSWLDWIVEFPGGVKKERLLGRIRCDQKVTQTFSSQEVFFFNICPQRLLYNKQ